MDENDGKVMKTVVMKITPEWAAEVLATRNGVNRPVHRTTVDRYAADMLRGEWGLSHQGISFDTDGLLRNGQHRLLAVVQSGVTVEMNVTTDEPKSAFEVTDIGTKRTVGDLVGIQGVSNGPLLAASARLVLWFDMFPEQRWTGSAINASLSARTLVEEVVSHADAYAVAASVARPVHNYLRVASSAVVASAYLIGRVAQDEVLVDQFYGPIVTGENLKKWDPRLTLRNTYFGRRADRRTATRQYVLALFLKAWSAHVEEREVRLLRWTTGEVMPKLATLSGE